MTMTLIKPPALEPVTLAEVRQFLRLDNDGEDALLTGLIKAARETLEVQTGLALIDQTWRFYADSWPKSGVVRIAKYPVRSVVAVTAYIEDGMPVSIAGHDLHLSGYARPARLYLAARSRPVQPLSGLEIDFVAGFGETGNEVPDALRHAIMTLVAHWYEFRGVYGAAQQPVSYPPAFERAIGLWRRVSL
ncbi:head-tail connector protein [Phyllobacterium bourgognense]|uniref:Putative phiE125 gp8 family phage protein n=1 Tax=Phyllobacterium bourgognense TaxID=314236 RepID=A0A368YH44_9HYPH|nr:head-tail connector protein [Phyllobacterium bourgognense]RCW79550.1 putative phiE125 gp8 family phage protein [Phyllobacterium bourgognense]